MKSTLLKALLEVFLIVFSVMLAFYLDNIRQDANDRKALVLKLKELRKELITTDSTEFAHKYKVLGSVDDSIKALVKKINARKSATSLLDCYQSTLFYMPIENWSLERIVVDPAFDQLSPRLKAALELYRFERTFFQKGMEDHVYINDHRIEEYIFENLKYKFQTMPSGQTRKILRDSSVLYSDKLVGYLLRKSDNIDWIRYRLKVTIEEAMKTAKAVDEETRSF